MKKYLSRQDLEKLINWEEMLDVNDDGYHMHTIKWISGDYWRTYGISCNENVYSLMSCVCQKMKNQEYIIYYDSDENEHIFCGISDEDFKNKVLNRITNAYIFENILYLKEYLLENNHEYYVTEMLSELLHYEYTEENKYRIPNKYILNRHNTEENISDEYLEFLYVLIFSKKDNNKLISAFNLNEDIISLISAIKNANTYIMEYLCLKFPHNMHLRFMEKGLPSYINRKEIFILSKRGVTIDKYPSNNPIRDNVKVCFDRLKY